MLGQMAFTASIIQSKKIFTSVAQELTEAPFWRQSGMGKGHHLGTDSSSVLYQLGDYLTSGAGVSLSVTCGEGELDSSGSGQL